MCSEWKSGMAKGGRPCGMPPNLLPMVSTGRWKKTLTAVQTRTATMEAGTRRVIFSSTGGAIYGEQDVIPAPESHATRPCSPYGVSKASSELYLNYYRQQFGLLGTCFRLGSQRRLWPFFGLAAGVLHTSVAGQAELGVEGHDEDRWSLLLDASVGTGLRLYPRYYMTLAAHVQVADPYVAIHLADSVGATTGRPNLLLTLTVGAWL